MRLMLIEDDAITRQVVGTVLGNLGYEVETFGDAERALKSHGEAAYDVAIVDWMLPRMDGMEFIRRLRGQLHGEDCVVLVATSKGAPGDLEEALAAGADDYVRKPVNGGLLAVRMKIAARAVEQRRARRAAETAKKAALERLERMRRLESLGNLSRRIAHDLSDMLLAIHASANLARQEEPGSERIGTHLSRIARAASRMSSLGEALVDYAGGDASSARSMSLAHAVDGLEHVLAKLVGDRAKLWIYAPANLPPAHASPTEVRQALIALVTNSLEAVAEEGGEIRVAADVINCNAAYLKSALPADEAVPGRYVYAEVMDNGSGMDAGTRAHAFEPYFSTHAEDRGLGLASVLGIMRGHGGFISIDSKLYEGTAIRLHFPLAAVTDTPTVDRTGSAGRLPTSVVVAEDDSLVREIVEDIVTGAGCACRTAEDERSLVAAMDDDVEAVVLDLALRGSGGVGTLMRLRAERPNLRAVLTGGRGEREVPEDLQRDQKTVFLRKPYMPAELVQALRRAMR